MTDEEKGLVFGFVGVAIFALTLPLTRFALRDFDPLFLSIGRTVIAALIAGPLLVFTRQTLPSFADLRLLAFVVAGVVFGFPILSAIASRTVPASHGGVVLGALPLATALMSTYFAGERPSRTFWLWGILGSILVITFALGDHSVELHWGDGLLALAVIAASMGYAAGGQLAKRLGGWQVICWALVLAVPITLPLTLWMAHRLNGHESTPSCLSFLYLGVMSQLAGFFFWNRGLALGGIARVGQVQLLQSSMTLVAASIILGEQITPRAVIFAVLIAACVWCGRKAAVR
ncbi:MAG: DMT family transporter [Aestuariivirga sp.]